MLSEGWGHYELVWGLVTYEVEGGAHDAWFFCSLLASLFASSLLKMLFKHNKTRDQIAQENIHT